MKIILILAFALLAGCAGMTVQWPASCLNLNLSGVTGCSATLPSTYAPPVIPESLRLPEK